MEAMKETEVPGSIRCEFEEKGGIDGITESLPDDQNIEAIVSVARSLFDLVRARVLFALCMQPMHLSSRCDDLMCVLEDVIPSLGTQGWWSHVRTAGRELPNLLSDRS